MKHDVRNSQLFTNYQLPVLSDGVRLPDFTISDLYRQTFSLSKDCTADDLLLALCLIGLDSKVGLGHLNIKEYKARMTYEFRTFKELGISPYVLMIWEILDWCRMNEVPVGPGRGSSCGSLVFYLIGITEIDSLKHGLYFERFLSKTRAKFKLVDGVRYYDGTLLMDVDIDISPVHRGKVVDWLRERYPGRVAKTLNVSTFTTKILLKDLCKAILGMSEQEALSISRLVPERFGQPKDLDESIQESPKFAEFASAHPELIDAFQKIKGKVRHFGVHASAYVVTHGPIGDLFPLQATRDGEVATAYDMGDSLEMAIKVDLLGVSAIHLIDGVCKDAGITRSSIPMDDPCIYKFVKRLRCPYGLFQIEGDANLKGIRLIQPTKFEHLSAITALIRPGAFQFVEPFAKYVRTGNVQSIHPFFDDVFSETGGICLFQEDLLRAAKKIGFSLEDAELLRRTVGKKSKDELPLWKERVDQQFLKSGLENDIKELFWKILSDSVGYSFNKSHAIAYSTISAMTIYLKAKYPLLFFLNSLNLLLDEGESDRTEKISRIVAEMPILGVNVLPPSVTTSDIRFIQEDHGIRWALNAIKGVANKSIEGLLKFRSKQSSKFDIFEGSMECGLDARVMEALIMSGALDSSTEPNRPRLLYEYRVWKILTDRERKWCLLAGKTNSWDLFLTVRTMAESARDTNSKQLVKPSRMETLRKKTIPFKERYELERKNIGVSHWRAERNLLGFSYSTDLYRLFQGQERDFIRLSEFWEVKENHPFKSVGEVLEVRDGISGNGNPYFGMTLSDRCIPVRMMLFNTKSGANIDRCAEDNNRLPISGDIVAVTGQKKGEDFAFIERAVIQIS